MKFEIKDIVKGKSGILWLTLVGTTKDNRRLEYTMECGPGQEQAILAEFQVDHKAAIAKYDASVELLD